LQQKLKHIKNKIKQWNKEVFDKIIKEKKEMEKRMDDL